MRKALMSVTMGLAMAALAVGPSMAQKESSAEVNSMHHQQVGRAKKALENALVALQDSGDWDGKGTAIHGVEGAITEVDKEIARIGGGKKK